MRVTAKKKTKKRPKIVHPEMPPDWAKLVYWGLIEEEPKPPDDTPDDTTRRTSGSWRPTGAGYEELMLGGKERPQ